MSEKQTHPAQETATSGANLATVRVLTGIRLNGSTIEVRSQEAIIQAVGPEGDWAPAIEGAAVEVVTEMAVVEPTIRRSKRRVIVLGAEPDGCLNIIHVGMTRDK